MNDRTRLLELTRKWADSAKHGRLSEVEFHEWHRLMDSLGISECPRCAGSGYIDGNIYADCPACDGFSLIFTNKD